MIETAKKGEVTSSSQHLREKAMVPRSSTPAWRIPGTGEPGGLQSMGEGDGAPLQYSCLEDPRDRGARWAAVHGVAQSRTRLKRLSLA